MERVEVKDVRVPAQLMRAMAAEAEAAREARAKVNLELSLEPLELPLAGDCCRGGAQGEPGSQTRR